MKRRTRELKIILQSVSVPWSNRAAIWPGGQLGWLKLSPFGLVFIALTVFAAETNGPSDAPTSSLRPPRGEIPPSFWELYGAWLILGSVVAVVVMAFVIWFITRPKPVTPVPFSVQARQELEPLRQLPEDGALLSRTSQIVRHYLAAMFNLASEERTTTEFSGAVLGDPRVGPALAGDVSEFLRICDLRKFAPGAPAASSGTVDRALLIIDRAEGRLAELKRPSAPVPGARPPALPGQAKGVPSRA